jgi:elongation factor G
MERDFRLKVRVGKPRVSYRETLRHATQVRGECVKQTGTSGLFAKLDVDFEPHRGEESILVKTRIKPDVVPSAYLAAAEQGIRGALESGDLGYPVMHIQATIVGGEMDEQFSNETAFQAAGADAVHKALRENIILLEPWMKLQVQAPEEFVGSIIADIGARRGEVNLVLSHDKQGSVEALVPLAGMFDYADKVRSLSQGRAASSLEPYDYKPAPNELLHSLLHPEEGY